MPRTTQTLLRDANTAGSGKWEKTEGYLNSVEATLDPNGTSATVEIYVSNSSHGTGVLLATLTLTAAQPTDGFSLPREENGWSFVMAKVPTAPTGTVKSCTALVGD